MFESEVLPQLNLEGRALSDIHLQIKHIQTGLKLKHDLVNYVTHIFSEETSVIKLSTLVDPDRDVLMTRP